MNTSSVQLSGRQGEWVYYMRGRKQCRRRYVRPRDPRTPAQLRVRAALAAASRYWSHCQEITDEQRLAWEAVANQRQSRPRAGQSGPLTGQQYYVACQCTRNRRPGLAQVPKPTAAPVSKPTKPPAAPRPPKPTPSRPPPLRIVRTDQSTPGPGRNHMGTSSYHRRTHKLAAR